MGSCRPLESETMIKGLIGGLVGGAIGAAVWGAIAYYTGYEIGWIAWLVGALVGLLTGSLAGDDASPMTGVAAAVIALVAIAMGKFAVIHTHVSKASAKIHSEYRVTDDIAMIAIAEQVVEEWEKAAKPLKWPEGKGKDDAEAEADFPKDVWADAKTRWDAMQPGQRESYKQDLEAHHHEKMDEALAAIEAEAFKRSFDLFDIVFALLAIASAFKLGSGDLSGGGGD